MAAKKKAASAADADRIIVAFALRDHVEDNGDGAVTFTEGQRLELEQEEFGGLAERGICVKGVFVKMKTAVEGGRYSLKPHDTTWLAPHVYEAWKAAGYCEPTKDDPQVGAVLKAREDDLREAIKQKDGAVMAAHDLGQRLREIGLEAVAARAQAEKVLGMIAPAPDSGNVLDDEMQALLSEVQALVDMLPEEVKIEDAGDVPEPRLNLN